MAVNKIKKAVQKKLVEDQYTPLFESIVSEIIAMKIPERNKLPYKNCEKYEVLKSLPADETIDMLISLIELVNHYHWSDEKRMGPNLDSEYFYYSRLLKNLLRSKVDFPRGYAFSSLFGTLYDGIRSSDQPWALESFALSSRPIDLFVNQIEKHIEQYGLYDSLKVEIDSILQHGLVEKQLDVVSSKARGRADAGKAVQKLKLLAFNTEGSKKSAQKIAPFELGAGMAGTIIRKDIRKISDIDNWHKLFRHLDKASGSKPSKKFSDATDSLVSDIGASAFKAKANHWIKEIADAPIGIKSESVSRMGEVFRIYEYIEPPLFDLLKGLCWSLSRFHDQQTLKNMAALAEKSFETMPGQGPAAAAIGNAAIYALGHSKGINGVSHLSRLKLRIKQNIARKLIQKYIDEKAELLKTSSAQLEETAVPDFGLQQDCLEEVFDDYTLRLSVIDVGQTELQWFTPEGKKQKTVPAYVKKNQKTVKKYKKYQDLAKQIKQASTAQRDRIDRLYTEAISWDLDIFDQYYLNHGLVGHIAQRLVWRLDDKPALFHKGHWQDCEGEPVKVQKNVRIELWHPIESDLDTVLKWRHRLELLNIKQPFKQTYREIYLLTDAELDTRVYSNRMAAHFVKQHQFRRLAALRGWDYALLGAYDDGKDGEIATKPLSAHHLTAHYWINEIADDTESFNDAGIWDYVATDQIRFTNEAEDAVPLVDVPPIVLSEIMRDADLFVGVASVGNDPTWQDGGPGERPAYRDYWQSYSFGNLTEIANTRKQVLEKLLPKLKIKNVAKIDGKFLIVDGKKNSYKIHIGSGNILIAPNDKYLCIVPGRGADKNLNQLFLPFEGDRGLSIVLSKAFMLADDDKISDPTITSQL